MDELIRTLDLHLGSNDIAFLKRVYATPAERYLARLRAIDFLGKGHVLDAGCGFGQWSVQLAALNDHVVSLDTDADRITFARAYARRQGVTNLNTLRGRVEHLPYEDARFDAVFCYGTLQHTGWREAIAELGRVVRPGGIVYVSGNGFGWYAHLWLNRPNQASDYDPRSYAAKTFENTVRYEASGVFPAPGGDVLVEQTSLVAFVRELGLEVIASGAEGSCHLNPAVSPPEPFFLASYEHHPGAYEVVFRRP